MDKLFGSNHVTCFTEIAGVSSRTAASKERAGHDATSSIQTWRRITQEVCYKNKKVQMTRYSKIYSLKFSMVRIDGS